MNTDTEEKKIEIKTTLLRIDKKKLEPRDFPCLCVPFFGEEGQKDFQYRWEHAGMVDSVVRGAAHYFALKNISQTNENQP